MSRSPSPTKTRDDALHQFLFTLSKEEPVVVAIAGHCMSPLIVDSAQVRVKQAKHYWPGDVVVARDTTGRYFAHRVIGYLPGYSGARLLTQADQYSVADAPRYRTAVVGRIIDGDCEPEVYQVPLHWRVRAMGRFAIFIIQAFTRRLLRSTAG